MQIISHSWYNHKNTIDLSPTMHLSSFLFHLSLSLNLYLYLYPSPSPFPSFFHSFIPSLWITSSYIYMSATFQWKLLHELLFLPTSQSIDHEKFIFIFPWSLFADQSSLAFWCVWYPKIWNRKGGQGWWVFISARNLGCSWPRTKFKPRIWEHNIEGFESRVNPPLSWAAAPSSSL